MLCISVFAEENLSVPEFLPISALNGEAKVGMNAVSCAAARKIAGTAVEMITAEKGFKNLAEYGIAVRKIGIRCNTCTVCGTRFYMDTGVREFLCRRER